MLEYNLQGLHMNQCNLSYTDVFLPSPTSLLANLRDSLALVRELLTALPERHAGPGAPVAALGAALLAAHRLMVI